MEHDSRWRDAPGVCVSVCVNSADGVCLGCGMIRDERQTFVRELAREVREPLLQTSMRRLAERGRMLRFVTRYSRKCRDRGVKNPLRDITF